MALSSYPGSLPGPTAAPYADADVRMVSTLPGPRQLRPRQRAREGQEEVDFCYSHAQLAIYTAWLETTLIKAGAWFLADWPFPRPGVAERRFIGYPSYPVFFPSYGWHVHALCEVRDHVDPAGGDVIPPEPPETVLFLDRFTGAPSSLIAGHVADVQVGGTDAWTGAGVINGANELQISSDAQTADIVFSVPLSVPAGKALHISFKVHGDIGEPFTRFEWDVLLGGQTYYIYSTNGVTVYLDDDAASLGPFIFNPGLPEAEVELVICPDWFTVKVDGAVYANQQAYANPNPLAAGDSITGISAFYQGGATAYYTDYFKMSISDPPDPV